MKVFFSYSHMDEAVRDQLEVHCSMLKRNGEIEAWHDRRILGGEDFDQSIRFELEEADLILLVVSQHFLNSDYCFSVELQRALERSKDGTAHVLPIIAEVCDWHHSPIGQLKALPKDGKPLSKHANINDGFLEVVSEIRKIISRRKPARADSPPKPAADLAAIAAPVHRSSNLRLKKEFTQAQRDRFLFASFEYMASFFESSLAELEARNREIETIFRKISGNAFTSQVYKHGKPVTQCQISISTLTGRSHEIKFSHELRDNSYNESLSAYDDGHALFLKPSFFQFGPRTVAEQLTQEGAAEYYWSMLIDRLQ